MQAEHASRTALAAAAHRAAHQLLEHGSIIFDPMALPILGADGERLVRESAERPDSRRMRLFIAARPGLQRRPSEPPSTAESGSSSFSVRGSTRMHIAAHTAITFICSRSIIPPLSRGSDND
jgi:hypothetical protein